MKDQTEIFDDPKKNSEAYKAGYDAGKNGSNTINTHFRYFATKELMNNWALGNKQGKGEGLD